MTRQSRLFIKKLASIAQDEETVFEVLPDNTQNRKSGNLIQVDLDKTKQYPFPEFEKHIIGIICYLSELGYIHFPKENDTTVFTLTYKALHFREISAKNILHTMVHHVFFPIAVSVISSIITTHIALTLQGLL